jgi:hypothetical protein
VRETKKAVKAEKKKISPDTDSAGRTSP